MGREEAGVAGQLAYDLARSERVPTVDLLIAAAALGHGCEVWHFATIKGHSPLQEHNLKSA
ncbi:hypothetical protein [Meiothermus ruber]|uniref:hypothetical protein n=1 Tax=Meiothermus ruber TaxID=277 RepID=UPI001F210465|nr:hypothetical protein [Meiothermus ruber]